MSQLLEKFLSSIGEEVYDAEEGERVLLHVIFYVYRSSRSYCKIVQVG